MKVAKIVSQTKEYERLQELIDSIETAIDDLGKLIDNEKFQWADISLSGFEIIGGGGPEERILPVKGLLSSKVMELCADDLKDMLGKKLEILKTQQAKLEV